MYASVVGRAVAALLDLPALIACSWFAGVLAARRYGGWGPDGAYTMEPLAMLSAIVKSVAAWLAYFACCEWWFGGTLGKRAVGISVTSLGGTRPNPLQAVARNLLRLVDGFGFYLVGAVFVLLTKKRQRLGDLIARTVVTKRPPRAPARAAALLASLALPVAAFGVTWYSGLIQAASNRWISEPRTRLHGEGRYETGVAGYISLNPAVNGPSTVHTYREGYASGKVLNETLIMDSVRFAAGKDGPERPRGVFKPGETAALLFDLSGIEASQGSSSGRIRMKARVLDPRGIDVVSPIEHDDEVPSGPRRLVPRSLQFGLPESCLPGPHRLDLVIEDLVAGRHLKASLPFTVER
jgi:uncharacterized RDD family membrane protein YckC